MKMATKPCKVHGTYERYNSGKCPECDKYDTKLKREGCTIDWKVAIPKLDMKPGYHMHHSIDKLIPKLVFDTFPKLRSDYGKQVQYTFTVFMATTPRNWKQELRLRTELLFCRPMKAGAHISLHKKMRRDKVWMENTMKSRQ